MSHAMKNFIFTPWTYISFLKTNCWGLCFKSYTVFRKVVSRFRIDKNFMTRASAKLFCLKTLTSGVNWSEVSFKGCLLSELF